MVIFFVVYLPNTENAFSGAIIQYVYTDLYYNYLTYCKPLSHISHIVSATSCYRAQNKGQPAVNVRPNEEMTGHTSNVAVMLPGQVLNNT